MGQIDVEKEKISLAKYGLGVLVSIILALTGWIATVYTSTALVLVLAGFIVLIISIIISIILLKYIFKKIESLKDL
ncbi:MAG: hypothetical protein ACQESH_06005 [Campylobacterota bacterium]